MILRQIAMASCLIVAGSAVGAETGAIVVDKIFQDGSFIHVLMRVSNSSAQEADRIEVVCDVFDGKGSALGRAEDVLHSVPAHEIAVGEVLIDAPPGGSEPGNAKCRIVR